MTKIGHFEILELIGRGGMGVVYKAVDPTIGRLVAIKVVRLIGYNDGDEATFLKERLFKEARAAGGLSHPGIVTVHQVGVHEEQAFIVMEYIDGCTLESRLASGTSSDPSLVWRVLLDVATALDYAHERGIVHRDIKPGNIMLIGPKAACPIAVKITDFGIAKTLLGHTSTKTGTILGTPYYMSPEQVCGLALDGRSDQFALAVIAYQMLSGRLPFKGENVTSICYQILHAEALPVIDLNPVVPKTASRVIQRALDKEAGKRFPTCAEFAAALLDSFDHAGAARNSVDHPAVGATAGWAPTPASSKSLPTPCPPERPSPKPPPVASPDVTLSRVLPLARYMPHFHNLIATVAGAAVVTLGAWFILSKAAEYSPQQPPQKAAVLPTRSPAPQPESKQQVAPSTRQQTATATIQQATPSKGRIVWTGQAAKGMLLRIEDGRASTGGVSGQFPGRPIAVHVFPAVRDARGLTVFTSDARYATPSRVLTASGPAIFSWDPRHVMDLTLWESPSSTNDWRRLVLRVNSRQIEAFVVEWKSL